MDQETPSVGRKPFKERKRQPVDALTHSVNHWIRLEALTILLLRKSEYSVREIADVIGEDVKLVAGHVKDLYDSGCIELAGYRMVRGTMRPVYRAIFPPFITREAYRRMSIEDRHDLAGAVVQGVFSESVASYRAGKMETDEDLCLVWDVLNLDAKGKRELHDHLNATFEGLNEIQTRADQRMAESGESGIATVAALLSFERGRS